MALEDLMKVLQENSAEIYTRRKQSESSMLQAIANDQLQQAQQGIDTGLGRRRPQGRGRQASNGGRSNVNLHGFKGKLITPIKGVNITSNYGPRIHPITGRQSNHTGVDLSAALGTPIRAVKNGVVKQANTNDSIYGNQIILGHGGGFQTMYGHMNELNVKPGQKVRRGDIIGFVGSTGLSTGPHLHFETWNHHSPVNPMQFI